MVTLVTLFFNYIYIIAIFAQSITHTQNNI